MKDFESDQTARILALEERVEELLLSRRILMTMVIEGRASSSTEQERLAEENERLRQSNLQYAHLLMAKNRELCRLSR